MNRLVLTLIFSSGVLVFPQTDFCALRLRVIDPHNNPVQRGRIDLIDSTGSIVKSTDVKDGYAEICDFDFGAHSVAVHADGLMDVVIKGARIEYWQPKTLTAVLNFTGRGDGGSNGCGVNLRVKDERGMNLPYPRVSSRDDMPEVRGDRFGRVAVGVLSGRQTFFTISADGHSTVDLPIRCLGVEEYEKTVILQRRSSP